jgi:hypothetical protein
VGSFGSLDGGLMPNAALMFSGGVHDSYFIEASKYMTNQTEITWSFAQSAFRRAKDQDQLIFIPTIDELFEILKYAIANSSIIGCFAYESEKSEKCGITNAHQYNIAQVFHVNDKRVIKIQNPHNTEDELKRFFVTLKKY